MKDDKQESDLEKKLIIARKNCDYLQEKIHEKDAEIARLHAELADVWNKVARLNEEKASRN